MVATMANDSQVSRVEHVCSHRCGSRAENGACTPRWHGWSTCSYIDEFPAEEPTLSGVGDEARLADMALRAFNSMWTVADAWSREKVGRRDGTVGWGGLGEEEQWQRDWWQAERKEAGGNKGNAGKLGVEGSVEERKYGSGRGGLYTSEVL